MATRNGEHNTTSPHTHPQLPHRPPSLAESTTPQAADTHHRPRGAYTATLAGAARSAWSHHTARPGIERRDFGPEAKPRRDAEGGRGGGSRESKSSQVKGTCRVVATKLRRSG